MCYEHYPKDPPSHFYAYAISINEFKLKTLDGPQGKSKNLSPGEDILLGWLHKFNMSPHWVFNLKR